jgi:hypothetical protein
MRASKCLSKIIGESLELNKCRRDCLVGIMVGLMIVRSVNLSLLANVLCGSVLRVSRVRRLERFFGEVRFNYDSLSKLLMELFYPEGQAVDVILDRTNWQFGKKDINMMMLSVAYKGASIPVM